MCTAPPGLLTGAGHGRQSSEVPTWRSERPDAERVPKVRIRRAAAMIHGAGGGTDSRMPA
ncbi:hypothetical protein FHR37_004661 [Actinopolymorpha cephalotaxi]|uniref:Uncharacterized protein n=1 Tax=Actinopolymorpha cephalotaxi TaxID=504797 RepID=A0ABX2S831_9ACTN|nr:hypothetical protein [Actinopolymorpha cephalotaxi]